MQAAIVVLTASVSFSHVVGETDQNGGKMAKIDTQFMTKTAEKPYFLGPHIPNKGVPPGGGVA